MTLPVEVNPLLTGGGGSGYNVSRSVRLRKSANAYLNRTFSTPTDGKKFTYSVWFKLGSAGVSGDVYDITFLQSGVWNSNQTQISHLCYSGYVGQIYVTQHNGSSAAWFSVNPAAALRDPAAWYHMVYVWDTAQATASDRVKLYINGVQLSGNGGWGPNAYPPLNHISTLNTATTHYIGNAGSSGYPSDVYFTDINFIDGQALTPSSFGGYNSGTGGWEARKYAGTYGTNGFRLNFSDNSAATAAAIGKDSSGNGNNWTPNNISLTAGVTYDSMIDSPTTGSGSSNYCVMNPLFKSTLLSGLSDGNLKITGVATGNFYGGYTGSMFISSGKIYWEVKAISLFTTNGYFAGGIATNKYLSTETGGSIAYCPGGTTAGAGTGMNFYPSNTSSSLSLNGSTSVLTASYAAGDVMNFALDASTGKFWIGKNNTWLSSGNPSAGTNEIGTITGGTSYAPWFGCYITGDVWAINLGQQPFAYTPPTGFLSLNTYNLPTPTISNGASYMAATTYTGNGGTQAISNTVNSVSFQPDFVWMKKRSAAESNILQNSIAGTTKFLMSNSTAAEDTSSAIIQSFDTNGFTVGASSVVNGSATTYVGWQWKAGGTAVSNTAGTITSQVSANASAGFSVVTYTGTGANATVGHGLGVAPKMVIVKVRSAVDNWQVYRSDFSSPANDYLQLNTTIAKSTYGVGNGIWNGGATSSIFGVGPLSGVNGSGMTYVAYCFSEIAGYSKMGSYTGNGSADGTFVYCGFRPRYILQKASSTTSQWMIFDTSRNTYNVLTNAELLANSSAAEGTGAWGTEMDILSNGFKFRGFDNTNFNYTGVTYIYYAIAETPFKNALAR